MANPALFLNISCSRLECFLVMIQRWIDRCVYSKQKIANVLFQSFRPENIRRKIITETSVSTLVWRWSYCAEVGRNFVRTAWVTLKCFNHELIFPQVRQWSHIRLIKLSRLTWTIRAAKNGCNWRKKFVNRSVMYSRYITVNFHWKTYERFPISRQRGRGIRCHSWVPGPVYFS